MATYLLEVGTEELPAEFIDGAVAQWRARVGQSLAEAFLTPEAIEIFGTPRRLALLFQGLPDKQPDREEEIKGPPAKAAFKDGAPTKAAEGFARKQDVPIEALEVRETDKGPFVFIQKQIVGRPAAEILQELVPGWITSLEGKRFMRWGDGDLRFPRPIRWLVSLLDAEILPLEFVNGSETIRSDRTSRGHRVLHPEPVEIPQAQNYLDVMAQASVQADIAARREAIAASVQAAAQERGGWVSLDADLLAEVTNLVEYPSVVVGKFDTEFLELPSEVIAMEMIDHQRYFPVWADESQTQLLPYFVTASNGDPSKGEVIAAGNERVIRARLADGQFFFKTDRAEPLESFLPKLEPVTFQEKLGSVRAKIDRICQTSAWVAEQLQTSPEEREQVARAALLCKADLASQMVYEFPELQGVMGEKYARACGESEAIATAISEHYLPRGAGDKLPETLVGQIVGIGDRLDTLTSIFGLGMIPSGSSDPFALRRAANAIVSVVWTNGLGLDLKVLLAKTVASFIETFGASEHTEGLAAKLEDFFLQRVRTALEEIDIDYDLINAVLGEGDREYADRALANLVDVRVRAQFLQSIRDNGTLDTIYETVNRSTKLAAKGDLDTQQLDPSGLVDAAIFDQPSERAFLEAIAQLVPQTEQARADRNYQLLVDGLVAIAPTVSEFFDGPTSVLVMADDGAVRQNRLNLLGLLRNHARVLADFGPIIKAA